VPGTNWIYVNDADPANVYLEIDTSDASLLGIYTIEAYATATNIDPVGESTHISFQLIAYPSRCVQTVMSVQSIATMDYQIGYSADPEEQTLDGFTDTVSLAGVEHCGPRLYTLSGTAYDQGMVHVEYVDVDTSKLVVQTTDPAYIGSYTVNVHVAFEDHPWLTDTYDLT
jgi:hypothetical protein